MVKSGHFLCVLEIGARKLSGLLSRRDFDTEVLHPDYLICLAGRIIQYVERSGLYDLKGRYEHMPPLEDLARVIANGWPPDSEEKEIRVQTDEAIKTLFGERYHSRSMYRHRTVFQSGKENVSFAGFVHEDAPDSGAYRGMSLIWFPVGHNDEQPASSLLTLVCGTKGLSPDEHILGRPGHVRHLQGLRRYLAATVGVSAWVKHDPTNLGQPVPKIIQEQHPQFSRVYSRYGNYIYCAVEVPKDPEKAQVVAAALLDLYAWERNWTPLKAASGEITAFRNALRKHLFPRVAKEQLVGLLRERRFVVLQGPPGTGKTRMAKQVLRDSFQEKGRSVQFHPAVTYETFVSGIMPAVSEKSLAFTVSPGWLVQAIRDAQDGEFLLHVDEINRADLSRVLGEAIYLFEPREIASGELGSVRLPQELDDGTRDLTMPQGLYVLGTMNTADRSIAILDMAVRRRFAFVDIWPDIEVVANQGIELATEAFSRLQDIFVQYSPDDALALVPGHSYFLAESEPELRNRLVFELIPLLREYLLDGRLGSCDSEIRAYIDWLEGEIANGVKG